MRIGIVGSREYPELGSVWVFVEKLAVKYPDAVIISGGALGVDTVATVAGRMAGLVVIEYLPDYARFGRNLAPLERNSRIVDDSDVLIAFWDGVSTGTLDSIQKAQDKGIRVKVLRPTGKASIETA